MNLMRQKLVGEVRQEGNGKLGLKVTHGKYFVEALVFENRAKLEAYAAKKKIAIQAEGEKEILLYGLPKGATERHEEVLLLTKATPELIEKVKGLAGKDGFHSFRVAEIDLSVPPNFSKIFNKGVR